MPYISTETINEIRNKTDIVEVISRYVPLTKRGNNYFGICPFHDDHNPSMSVSPDKQMFKSSYVKKEEMSLILYRVMNIFLLMRP